MSKHQPRLTAFLIFGFGGTLAGIVIHLLPFAPDVGFPFILGWWIAAAIGSLFFPHGFGSSASK